MKVSVIIPAYNAGVYIGEAIESALNQSYNNIEIIVCNDGSTDHTEEVVKRYDTMVIYVSQENQGCPSARNRAISLARGELIAFLDSDDKWLPNKLEKQIPLFRQKKDIAMVFSDAYIKDINDRRINNFFNISCPYRGKVFYRLVMNNFIPISTVVVKRDILTEIGLFDTRYKIAADWDLSLKISQRYHIDYIDTKLGEYRVHSNNICKDRKLMLEESLDILNRYLRDSDKGNRAILKKSLSLYKFAFGMTYLREGQGYQARKYFFYSIKDNIFNLKSYIAFLGALSPRILSKLVLRSLGKEMHG